MNLDEYWNDGIGKLESWNNGMLEEWKENKKTE
jgi:hypothetical protein